MLPALGCGVLLWLTQVLLFFESEKFIKCQLWAARYVWEGDRIPIAIEASIWRLPFTYHATILEQSLLLNRRSHIRL